MNTFYITTPIYYANSEPHLGHLYTTIVADTVNRYKKQRGFDTFFLTGTDEHGINIQRKIELEVGHKVEITEMQEVFEILRVSETFKELFKQFGIDDFFFMRTTNGFHVDDVQELWLKIAESKTPKRNSCIYKGFYEAWFCAACAEFKTEKEYEIKNDEPYCLIHLTKLELVSEESYFFRLSDYAQVLLETIEGTEIVNPEIRRNEIVAFIKNGLQDISISRLKSSVIWGIPVPNDENHTMYVWLDALFNYWTAIKYKKPENYKDYWQNVTHLVGKDILRFHTVYWFSFLMAAGIDLPKKVYAHGMWLDGEGRKMGKTLGNVIKLEVLDKYFQNDEIRYFVLREMVFGQDGKFSYENFIDRTTADLANGLGNLSSRTLSMINKYRDGIIPNGTIHEENFIHAKRASVGNDEQELASVLELARDEFLRKFDDYDFSGALETLWAVIARIDNIITTSKPWELIKDENQTETLNAVLYRATETLRWLCVLLYPIMPDATREIYKQIGLSEDISTLDPKNLIWGELRAGNKIGEPKPVFPRVDKNRIMENVKLKMENEKTEELVKGSSVAPAAVDAANAVEEEKIEENFITIDDFFKVQLKVGEILVAEKIPNADKLLRFEIDLGEEKPRQILAGLAEYYEPGKLVGRKVVVVANLKPRKMRGLESQGMICAASLEGGDDLAPAMATFLEDVKNGARLK